MKFMCSGVGCIIEEEGMGGLHAKATQGCRDVFLVSLFIYVALGCTGISKTSYDILHVKRSFRFLLDHMETGHS